MQSMRVSMMDRCVTLGSRNLLSARRLAVDHLLRRGGVRPDMVGGHSYGELVALASAGAFDPGTLLEVSEARAEAILAATGDDPGAMAASPPPPTRSPTPG